MKEVTSSSNAYPIESVSSELLNSLMEFAKDAGLYSSQDRFKQKRVDQSKQEAKAYSKDLSTCCGRLLEETEDGLAEIIKKGSVRGGDVSTILCQDLSAHCSRTSASHQGNGYGNGSDGEL
ncbi:hypothetical protein Prudu_013289 [Prunus dulcis]|uniref:DUF3456 domain-containing protein n=1 Tax=Prunus dulcis TaxID=3755 RepID=A0A4Y1RFH7_PRUDU|nr:hypothetical protein Prudu_013289 [Prunus dulcis]